MEDFYVYLPSNSSALYFPDNTPNHFATQLGRRINLPGPYECAVTQIQYLHSWDTFPENSCTITPHLDSNLEYPNDPKLINFTSIGSFIRYIESLYIPYFTVRYITRDDRFVINWSGKQPVKIEGYFLQAMGFGTVLTYKPGDTVSTLNNDHEYFKNPSMRRRQNDSFRFDISNNVDMNAQVFTLDTGHYNTIDLLLEEVNSFAFKLDKHSPPFSFKFDKTRNKVYVNLIRFFKLTISEELGRLLGFKTLEIIKSMYGDTYPDIHNDIFTFYVYADIVSGCLIGDTEAPLLEAFQPLGSGGDIVTERFAIRNYKPVSKRSFESILIQIRNEKGVLIPFRGGYVLITLHFRPRRFIG